MEDGLKKSNLFKLCRFAAIPFTLTSILTSGLAQAQTTYHVMPVVTVTGNHVDFSGGSDSIYNPFYTGAMPGPPNIPALDPQKFAAATKNRTVCSTELALSQATRQTTSQSDVNDRWLAAQNVFANLHTRGWLLSLLIGGPRLQTSPGGTHGIFIVMYADGYWESWLVAPGWQTSTIKLLDQPMPNSMKGPATGPGSTCLT